MPSRTGGRKLRIALGKKPTAEKLIAKILGWVHERYRILAIDTEISDQLVEQGINAVFTVEPT